MTGDTGKPGENAAGRKLVLLLRRWWRGEADVTGPCTVLAVAMFVLVVIALVAS